MYLEYQAKRIAVKKAFGASAVVQSLASMHWKPILASPSRASDPLPDRWIGIRFD